MSRYSTVKAVRPVSEYIPESYPTPEPTVLESLKRGWDLRELELVASLNRKYGTARIDREYDDEKLSPSEIKKLTDLEVSEPTTLRAALAMKHNIAELDEISQRFAEVGFDFSNPINLVAAWVGAGAGAYSDLGNVAADIALTAASGPAVAGARRLAQLGRLSRWAPSTGKLVKRMQQTELYTGIRHARSTEDFLETASKIGKKAKRFVTNEQVLGLTRAGTANALVELGIHNLEAQQANHYDIGPAIAMGVFAPVFLKGMVSGFGLGVRGISRVPGFSSVAGKQKIKEPKVKITRDKISTIKNKLHKKQTLTDEEWEIVSQYDEGAEFLVTSKIDDSSTADLIDVVLTEKNPGLLAKRLEKIDDPDFDIDIKQLKAIDEANKRFGEQFSEALKEIVSGMILSNHRLNISDAFPWLSNPSAFKKALRQARQDRWGDNWKSNDVDTIDMNNLFTQTAEQFDAYGAKYKIKDKIPEPVTPPDKLKDLQKRLDEKLDNTLADEGPAGETARTAKELMDNLDEFISCVRKGGPDVS